ncbi:MAG: autotransporter outer membrane beta-barrel domain-containing protein, partial [Acidobacteria bacterium]
MQVTDLVGTGSQDLTITINPAPSIAPATLPPGDAGVTYNQNLNVTGGTAPYTWSISAGTLPNGINLAPSGSTATLNGSTTAGSYNFTIQVIDNVGGVASPAYTLIINPAMSGVAPAALPAGDAGLTYTQNLRVAGGTAPYAWSVSAGSLPTGINLTPSGPNATLSGSAAAGNYNFTIQVIDNVGGVASQAYTLVINPALSGITPGTLPQGDAGVTYNQNLNVSGGTAPYAWSVSAGALPTGINLTPSGSPATLSGSAAAGTYNFTIKVTDNAGGSDTQAYVLTINSALSITTPSSLPAGEITTFYSQQLNASGGSGSYTWALINSTSLPQGVDLNTSTGLISGTPASNTVGPHNFTVQVTDTLQGSASLTFSLNTVGGPSITTGPTLPNGTVNAVYSGVTLMASDGTAPYSWSITVGALPANLILNGSTGAITGTPIAQGTFNFTAQVTDA